MDKKFYNLGLMRTTTDIHSQLYDAAKWCHDNGYKPKQIAVSEEVYKSLYSHPQLRGFLNISKCFPPVVEILGFSFIVDFNKVDTKTNVPVVCGYVTLEDALVFEF